MFVYEVFFFVLDMGNVYLMQRDKQLFELL